eukprot:552972-Amphidinium_carterae.1
MRFGGAYGEDKQDDSKQDNVKRPLRFYCTGYFDDDEKIQCDWQSEKVGLVKGTVTKRKPPRIKFVCSMLSLSSELRWGLPNAHHGNNFTLPKRIVWNKEQEHDQLQSIRKFRN